MREQTALRAQLVGDDGSEPSLQRLGDVDAQHVFTHAVLEAGIAHVSKQGTTFERFERSSPMPDKGERDSKAGKVAAKQWGEAFPHALHFEWLKVGVHNLLGRAHLAQSPTFQFQKKTPRVAVHTVI